LNNYDADHPVWIASSIAPTPPDVIIEKLSKSSIKPVEATSEAMMSDLMVIDDPDQEPEYDWINPIKIFLENQPLSDDSAEVECIVRKSKKCHLIDEILF
jgi:hypothetical protein